MLFISGAQVHSWNAFPHLGCRYNDLCNLIGQCDPSRSIIVTNNGHWNYNSSDAVLHCDVGYVISGPGYIYCRCNGTWNASVVTGSCIQASKIGMQIYNYSSCLLETNLFFFFFCSAYCIGNSCPSGIWNTPFNHNNNYYFVSLYMQVEAREKLLAN